jgi:hypothetical protein
MSYFQISKSSKDPFGKTLDPYGHANREVRKEIQSDPLSKSNINTLGRRGSYLDENRNLGLKTRDQIVSGVTGKFTNEENKSDKERNFLAAYINTTDKLKGSE